MQKEIRIESIYTNVEFNEDNKEYEEVLYIEYSLGNHYYKLDDNFIKERTKIYELRFCNDGSIKLISDFDDSNRKILKKLFNIILKKGAGKNDERRSN